MARFQANEAILLMHCCYLKDCMELHPGNGRDTCYRSLQREYERTRKTIRRMLRKRGYSEDKEITAEMDHLAEAMLPSWRALNWCIMKGDKTLAAWLEKRGFSALRISQDLQDAPPSVRYRREIEYAKENLAYHFEASALSETGKKPSKEEIAARVAAYFRDS